jgi:predicted MPP superfamily phosphohydrolase
VTTDRFYVALALFHLIAAGGVLVSAGWWKRAERCRVPRGRWLGCLGVHASLLAVATYLLSLALTVAVTCDVAWGRRLGPASGRLMSQAVFLESTLLAVALAYRHARAGARRRAWALGAVGAVIAAVYVDAVHVEPRLLRVREHAVDRSAGRPAGTLRILHVTDLQTPAIGAHEERALRTGLSYRPDLIVLTGDYVQYDLADRTEAQAARDLRALIARIGFTAPLGVFATEGDAGPSCDEVFAGAPVRCLADQTVLLRPPGLEPVALTALSKTRGRVREPEWLRALFESGPAAPHRFVVSHAPDFVDALHEPVDLVLAGHTHGGQVVLPFFGPLRTGTRLPRRYAGDLHDFGGTPLHVSRGVGMERDFAPQVRFFCPPEICVLDVRLPAR